MKSEFPNFRNPKENWNWRKGEREKRGSELRMADRRWRIAGNRKLRIVNCKLAKEASVGYPTPKNVRRRSRFGNGRQRKRRENGCGGGWRELRMASDETPDLNHGDTETQRPRAKNRGWRMEGSCKLRM